MNFCFVLDDLLSASSQPGKNRRITDYLTLYRENNIKALVSLYKKIELPKEFEGLFTTYHFKIDDLQVPSVKQVDEIVDTIIKHLRKKEAVNINCAAGISHSGLILIAVMMKYLELDYGTSYRKVSEQRYAMEEDDYKGVLIGYERYLRNPSSVR
jgi:protein-tyrosine phosphatase